MRKSNPNNFLPRTAAICLLWGLHGVLGGVVGVWIVLYAGDSSTGEQEAAGLLKISQVVNDK